MNRLFPDAARSLFSVAEVAAMIDAGEALILAAEEAPLSALPRGNWIGGTSPFFMSHEVGGTFDRDRILVQKLPDIATIAWAGLLDRASLPTMAERGAGNGYTIVLMPGQSAIQQDFALHSLEWPGMFARPLAGWVTGVANDRIGIDVPKVFDGRTGTASTDKALVLHVALPDDAFARIDIVNLFVPDTDGPALTFGEVGDEPAFTVEWAKVDGVPTRLVDHIAAHGIDTRLPLVADYNGAMVNVATQWVDTDRGQVNFFAPVHPGMEYRFARPIDDYERLFAEQLGTPRGEIVFSCNCVLNYAYAGLEGRHTSGLTGPMSFGEIAYMLMTQTLVYVTVDRDGPVTMAAQSST
ncbi:DUF6976 family protein [Sphingomonas sp. Leaf10]|uniref:DUF6976 family protein n=1 Tax=Sphingomonas sp. Leaf10 TaxID=1735676 RepID=UPI0006F61549|nr:hypothetical protein [Sphingomonas sp. Leaf10]KQM36041.1 hypothetical protein ASE59_15330 [Sphingomonas sp. Leaf10]